MDTARLDVKPGARVRVTSVQGDLRLTGSDAAHLEAQAGRRGGLRAVGRGEDVELSCTSGCLVFLPPDCPVEIGDVSGDVRLTDLRAPVRVGQVGGDLRLRRLTSVTVDQVAGDLTAQRVSEGLEVGRAGGDVSLNRVDGAMRLQAVGGDLAGSSLGGPLQARVEGDASVQLDPPAGSESSLSVGGDGAVRVSPEASLVVELRAAGDLRVSSSGTTRSEAHSASLTLGSGAARLTVETGADLAFWSAVRVPGIDLASAITAQVESALAEVEADLDLESDSGVDGVGERVRKAVERALRPRPGAPARPASAGQEREMILRMLADRKITADEAEALFQALEGDG